jgi:hypothetical protein
MSESKLTVFCIPSHTHQLFVASLNAGQEVQGTAQALQQPMVLVTGWEMSQLRRCMSTPATSKWIDLKDNVGSMKYNYHHHYNHYSYYS